MEIINNPEKLGTPVIYPVIVVIPLGFQNAEKLNIYYTCVWKVKNETYSLVFDEGIQIIS